MTGKRWIVASAYLGALGILIGAFGAHFLPKMSGTTEKSVDWLNTGVEYHLYHVMAILGVGILAIVRPEGKWNLAGYCFLLGVGVFSGLLYVMAITQLRILGAFVPIGGVSFAVGWIVLARSAAALKP